MPSSLHQPPPSLRPRFTPASISRIDTPYLHSLHAYQGLLPWSPRGDRLLYAGLDASRDVSQIVIRDLSTKDDQVIGTVSGCDYHTAAYQQWILHGQGVVFRDAQSGIRGSSVMPATNNGITATFLPHLQIRAVSSDTQRGYGYSLDGTISAMRVEFSSGEVTSFFDAKEAVSHLPPSIAEDCPYSFSHFVPNADESLAFIKVSKPEPHRKRPGQMDDWGAFFVYDLKAHTFLCLGDRISGHPQWTPDGKHIVNIMQPLDGADNRWLVTQDATTGEVRRLVDFPIEGPGHPVVSPDGKYLVTDAYLANRQTCPVYLIDLASGQVAEIARFDHNTRNTDTYQPGTIFRSNLHPVWSPDSRHILVNVNESGSRLGMFVLQDFLPH